MTMSPVDIAAPEAPLDVASIRADFPILQMEHRGNPIIYLDNSATSQTPRQVIDAIEKYYTRENANVHRGVHYLSQVATHEFEEARKKIGNFIGTPLACEVIFTRGTTEAINLVAQSYGRQHVGPGDEVLISHMEHHSNIVPWQMLCEEKGATLKVVPITDTGEFDLEAYGRLLSDRTRIVAVTHVSNALGTVTPLKQIIDQAHQAGVPVLVDGAQSIPHMPVNVYELGCDFYAFSGHKMYGPTGTGVLFGKARLLDAMPPWQGGGDMILSVSFEKTTYNNLPYKFEAGTPHIEGAIALGAAVDYLSQLGMANIAAYEHQLLEYGTRALEEVPGLTLIGTAPEKAGVLSFVLKSAHPHDVGQLLDDAGIAVRAGHHCAQPVMKRFGIAATTRASLGIYNTREEIDALAAGLHNVNKVFS